MKVKIVGAIVSCILICCFSAMAGDNVDQSLLSQYTGLYYDKQSNLYFINDNISFSIRPVNNEKYLDKIKFSIDNGPYNDYAGKIKFEKDGFHIVRFKAVDPVLNWSPTQNFRIYVDLTTPNSNTDWIGKTYSNSQSFFVSSGAKMILSAQDNLSGISRILWKKNESEKVHTYSSGKYFQEGEHHIKIAAIDNVGNAEKWNDLHFTVDSTPPKSNASIRGNTFTRNTKTFIDKGSYVSLKANDDISGVGKIEYSINDGPINIFKHKILVDKKISKIKYRSVDNVSNKEAWKSLSVFLDSTPPKLSVKNNGKYRKVAGKIYARSGFTVSASVHDNDSGAKSLYVDNNFEDKRTKKLIFDKPGEHSFYLGAEDNVGNTANSVNYTVVIDETPPITKLNASNNFVERDGIHISSLPNKIDFSADDNGVGVSFVEISYDGKKYIKAQGAIDLATWSNGKKTIYYRSVDKLGNLEQQNMMTIYVRNRGPRVDLFVEKDDMPGVSLSELIKIKKLKRIPATKKTAPVKKKAEKKIEKQ